MNSSESSQRWAWLAVAAGVLGFLAFLFSATVNNFDDGHVAVARELNDKRSIMALAQFAGWIATASLLVFAAGFYRHVRGRVPETSLLAIVAGAALFASVAANVIGYGSLASMTDSLPGNFAYFLEGDDPGEPLEEQRFPVEVKSTAYYDATNAVCYSWIAVCAAAGAAAVAAFRHDAFARWFGYFSAFIAAIMFLFVAIGLPFGAVVWGPLWLVVTGITLGFARANVPVARTQVAAS